MNENLIHNSRQSRASCEVICRLHVSGGGDSCLNVLINRRDRLNFNGPVPVQKHGKGDDKNYRTGNDQVLAGQLEDAGLGGNSRNITHRSIAPAERTIWPPGYFVTLGKERVDGRTSI